MGEGAKVNSERTRISDTIPSGVVLAELVAKMAFYLGEIEAKNENWECACVLLANLDRIIARLGSKLLKARP